MDIVSVIFSGKTKLKINCKDQRWLVGVAYEGMTCISINSH